MKNVIVALFCLFLLCACGTKRQYFTPSYEDGVLNSSENLRAKIVDYNIASAKLSDDKAIFKNEGILDFKLEKDYMLLHYQDGEFVIADNDGNLKILNADKEELYTHKFDASVLSVALNGDDIALVLANNTIVLANRSLGVKFSKTFTQAIAQDNRFAAPIFLGELIVYPTLDGKLIIFSRVSSQIVKDVVVSAQDFFNNIIHLSVLDDKMIAASGKKIIVVTPTKTFYLDTDIKEVLVDKNAIFILGKDGSVVKTDFELRKLNEKKFEFAIFNKASIYENSLYIFEKMGFLIKCDVELEDVKIFKLEGAIDKKSFMDRNKFYYDSYILDLDKVL
ncbi:hypothetical protein [Campylobacter helveticus]|uniref:hypothetical protein n=1 Tax=Campylobacter helveticus TaxID=28898 RepID=UPI0010450479|nr:hypothetical protein [Campylobacter helveticus]QBL11539.1 hypothetical protein A0073_03070 [Campylobacter helveticus]TNH35813.1 hypothetical protein FDW45_06910 [Campylobacter helveticus]